LIVELLVGGLVTGGLFALLSLGFTLIYKVTGVFNLAQGTIYMFCAYCIYFLLPIFDLGISIILSIIITIITSILLYKFIIYPLGDKKSHTTIITLSLAISSQAFASLIRKNLGFFSIPYYIPGYSTILGDRVVNMNFLAVIGTLVLLVLFGLFINRTRLTKRMNAVAQNIDLARLVGINIQNTSLISIGISAFLAGFAAVLYGPIFKPTYPLSIIFRIFPGLVLGGLGSLKGALVGSFIIAFLGEIVEFTIGGGYMVSTISFAVMFIVLIIKPSGLFGKEISQMKKE